MNRLFSGLTALLISASAALAGEVINPIYLKVGTLDASLPAPGSWGVPKTIALGTPEADEFSLPVMQEVPFAAAVWTELVPKDEEMQPAATVTVLDLSTPFVDDQDMKLPEEERSPNAMSAKQKEATVAPLKKIFEDSAFDVDQFRSDDMEQNENLVGAWWGGLTGALEIVDAHYIENTDKSLRGISFLYTEGGDINFALSSRILLYSPDLKTAIVYDLPLFSFPEIKKLNLAVGEAGEGPAVLENFRKGVAFARDRKKWGSTPMGKLIDQMEAVAKGTVVKRK